MAEKFNQEAIDALVNTGNPIPGQSLTNSPDQPYKWEGPPEFTNFNEALTFIAEQMFEEENYIPILQGIAQGIPLTDITLQVLQTGFQEGKWNPDLFMLLVEPTIYLLMALAEKAEVEFKITADEEEDLDSDDEQEIADMKADNLKRYAEQKIKKESKVTAGVLPKEIIEDIENLEIPKSLLERPEQPQESLLARGEEE